MKYPWEIRLNETMVRMPVKDGGNLLNLDDLSGGDAFKWRQRRVERQGIKECNSAKIMKTNSINVGNLKWKSLRETFSRIGTT